MYRTITVAKSQNAIPVLGAYSEDIGKRKNPGVPARLFDAFKEALARPGFKADLGDVEFVGDKLIVVGLGSSDSFKTDQARRVGARLLRALDRCNVKAICFQKRSDRDDEYTRSIARACGEGMGLANWRLAGYDGKATTRSSDSGSWSFLSFKMSFSTTSRMAICASASSRCTAKTARQ